MAERKDGSRFLLSSLALAAGFALLVSYVFLARAGLLYYLWVLPFAYVGTVSVLIGFVAGSRRRALAVSLIFVGALSIVGVTTALTASHGYPAPYETTFTSCTSVQLPNATSPWGYTYGSRCTSTPADSAMAFLWNFAYWLPVSGLALYSLPAWRKGEGAPAKAGHLVIGLVLLGALLLPLTGIPTAGL